MMTDALFVDNQIILATIAPMYSVTAAMNLTIFHKTAPTRFLPQDHHATRTGLVQGHYTPTPNGTDHTPPTMGTVMVDISTDHIMPLFAQEQKQQQFQKAHIALPIVPPQ